MSVENSANRKAAEMRDSFVVHMTKNVGILGAAERDGGGGTGGLGEEGGSGAEQAF